MSQIARVFVFLNLVVNVGFLFAAATFLAHNNDYKRQLSDEVAAHKASNDAKDGQIQKLESERDTFRSGQLAAQNENTSLERTNQALNQQVQAAEGDKKTKDTQIASLTTKLGELEETSKAAVTAWTALKNENDAVVKQSVTARSELASKVKELEAEQESLRQAKNKIEEQDKDITTKGEQIKSLDLMREFAVRSGIDFTNFDQAPAGIRGSVLNADNGLRLVLINRGATHGLKRGHTLDISRGATFVGRMKVDELRDSNASGLLTLLAPGMQVQAGDRVSVLN